ncbi:MAG: mRNA interferase MazF2 [Spirochaetae bacterium HGW-Spirochaetae-7]|jgi:mRNA interferase MazF|nr:MAG: mRNA interferase MazF2 [Spirochaetae bacterium HGW-Spirochaetae-7]
MIRGEIWWADFGIPFGSEPGFRRPVLIVQDDAFNKSKINTVIVIPLTTNMIFENAPGNVFLGKAESGLSKDAVVVVPQIGVIDKVRLSERAARLSKTNMEEVHDGLKLVLGIN